MDPPEAAQGRYFLVHLRVVLHRARAERVKGGVDRPILLREPRVVAYDVELAYFRQFKVIALERRISSLNEDQANRRRDDEIVRLLRGDEQRTVGDDEN